LFGFRPGWERSKVKKYEDWQKYVKEQMEKSGQSREISIPSEPRRNVPSISGDRYKIQRRAAPASLPEEREPEPPRPEMSAEPIPVANPQRKSLDSLSSPFVSVSDVWEAAEKSSRTKKTIKEESQALRQARLPGIERVAGREKPDSAPTSAKGRNHEQSREEIIERLVNPTITLEEAAKIMGVCKATVRRYTVKGILPHYRTAGNQRRFKLNDIINFLENQRK